MKKVISVLMCSGLLTLTSYAFATTDSCEDQKKDIEAKLAIAKQYSNTSEQVRLQKALDKVNTYCTESRQLNRAEQDLKKKERKVKQKELNLEDAKDELAEAKLDGRQDRVSKKERKVKEKMLDLEEAQDDLKQAQEDYKKLNN